MAEFLGSLCIVLHGHLPHVLHHGAYPHGEAWIHEAAAETYLPLLETLDEAAKHRARPALTISLSPILLEQLADPYFKESFARYLGERSARASRDRAEFERGGQGHFAYLAERWERIYQRTAEQFEKIGRDIPGAFAAHLRAGHIQILTGAATHAYLPLLLNDQMIWAQLAAGKAASARHLDATPRGVWLPECAYRPRVDNWLPAALYTNPRQRVGIDQLVGDCGLTHFFIDAPMLETATPLGYWRNSQFTPVARDVMVLDPRSGWRNPLEPAGVASDAGPPRCSALTRHPRVSSQVWSALVGYPAAGAYLEFHRKLDSRGLRYHRVTDPTIPLDQKQAYIPEDTFHQLYENVHHFCQTIGDVLKQHQRETGRPGVCVASFDAELFGHWWHEGPQFLRDVIFTLSRDSGIHLATAEEALQVAPDKVVRLPEGSWGKGGDHRVWCNEQNKWMWEIEYRAEGDFLKQLHALPWRQTPAIREMLERAVRQLLLLQASDWPFVVHSQGAVDYGITRFSGHVTNFNRALAIAESLAEGGSIDAVRQTEIDEMDAHDAVFREIDLKWWL